MNKKEPKKPKSPIDDAGMSLQAKFEQAVRNGRFETSMGDVYVTGAYGSFHIGSLRGEDVVDIRAIERPFDVKKVWGVLVSRLKKAGYKI